MHISTNANLPSLQEKEIASHNRLGFICVICLNEALDKRIVFSFVRLQVEDVEATTATTLLARVKSGQALLVAVRWKSGGELIGTRPCSRKGQQPVATASGPRSTTRGRSSFLVHL
jgi:hypothetical protein